jgi:probable lipoprotein NlpC
VWSNKYIGIPYEDKGLSFAGVYCWGLVRLVYAQERHIDLPPFLPSGTDPAAVAQTVADATMPKKWPWERVTDRQTFDVLLFQFGKVYNHVGIAIDHKFFLHSAIGNESRVDRVNEGPWHNRLVGAYRYVE